MDQIPLFKVYMSKNAANSVETVLNSGYIGQGQKVEEFEQNLKQYFNHDYLLTLNCGTSALHLALHLLKQPKLGWKGLNDGDEVLTTSLTCLYRNSQVLLSDGSTMFISDIVNKKYDGYVMSYNIEKNIIEPKKIINWYRSPLGNRSFIRLNHDKSIGKKSKIDGKNGVWVTDDHPVLTKDGYCLANQLKDDSLVVTKYRKFNEKQEQALYGMLLGDGGIRINKSKTITTARYYHGHSYLQEEYGNMKSKLFHDFNIFKSPKKARNQSKKSYQWTTRQYPYFYDMYKKFYINSKKILPIDISEKNFSDLTLAIWYMDDGSFTKKTESSVICSESFSKDENLKLQKILFNRFNLNCTFHNKKDTVRIAFNKNETEKLFSIIGKYIIPSMRYKLSSESDFLYPFDEKMWNLGQTETYYDKINVIKNKIPTSNKSKVKSVYCIDVEDNHNFISGGIVLHNCTATNWPIIHNNLNIKWVDIDPTTLNLDLDDLERKITPKTKVIMLVHWGGYPVDLDRVKKIQQKTEEIYGFKPAVIEDCAHAFGSTYKNKLIGTHGNINMFSFQAIKHLTTVDGGLLSLPHEELYRRGKLLRWYGINRETNSKDFRCESNVDEVGFKFHMNDVNATVGIENLKEINNIIEKHQNNAKYYDDNLKNINGLTLLQRHDDRTSSFWIYSMLVEKRDDFYKWMKECNIVVSQVHERNDKHSAVWKYKTHLPTLDKTIGKVVSIPVGWWVTKEQREYIVDCIKKGY